MGKHTNSGARRTGTRAAAALGAVALSSALVLGHAGGPEIVEATVRLTNAVIGAGGRDDGTGARLLAKLQGKASPAGYDYDPITYPATINLAYSRDVGVPVMRDAITAHAAEPSIVVLGYSEGALVAERVREQLQSLPVGTGGAPSEHQLTFVLIGAPFAPNGGVYERFPGLSLPFVIDPMRPAAPTRYDTVYHAIEYDPYADFPAYFNPLSLLNAALGVRYSHSDAAYDQIDPASTPSTTTTVTNTAGGHDTYVLYRSATLPLLGPIREVATLLGLTPFTERLLRAVEPLLRLAVDMGYTDRTHATVATPTPFSFLTPPGRVIETLLGVPEALREGVRNLVGGSTAPAPPVTTARTPVPSPDATASASDIHETISVTTSSVDDPPAERRHPTLVADGNKVTPDGAPAAPASHVGTADPGDAPAALEQEPAAGGRGDDVPSGVGADPPGTASPGAGSPNTAPTNTDPSGTGAPDGEGDAGQEAA